MKNVVANLFQKSLCTQNPPAPRFYCFFLLWFWSPPLPHFTAASYKSANKINKYFERFCCTLIFQTRATRERFHTKEKSAEEFPYKTPSSASFTPEWKLTNICSGLGYFAILTFETCFLNHSNQLNFSNN